MRPWAAFASMKASQIRRPRTMVLRKVMSVICGLNESESCGGVLQSYIGMFSSQEKGYQHEEPQFGKR